MSYLHPVNEELTVVFCFRNPTTGVALTGISASINVTVYDEAYGSFETGNPTEIAKGLYYYTFTPDTAGVWTPIAEYEGLSPFLTAPKAFLVGTDLETLLDAIKAATDNLPSDPADQSDVETAITTAHSTTDGKIDALQDLAQSDILDDATPFSGANIDAAISEIIQQVALTGHPANSIGKILYDFYNTRLGATRCGYIDNLSAGAAALEATLTAIKGGGWTDETLKAIMDGGDSGYTNIVGTGFTPDTHSLKNLSDDIDTIKTQTDKIREPKSDTTSSPYTLTNDTDEQTIIEETPSVYTHYDGIMLDIDALTQTISTIKVYFKVDGTNYRENVSMRLASVPASIPMLFLKEFASDVGWKITIQMSVVEGASRSISYRILKEENTS